MTPTAMEPWHWITVGLTGWVVLSILIAGLWTMIARELKKRHSRTH